MKVKEIMVVRRVRMTMKEIVVVKMTMRMTMRVTMETMKEIM